MVSGASGRSSGEIKKESKTCTEKRFGSFYIKLRRTKKHSLRHIPHPPISILREYSDSHGPLLLTQRGQFDTFGGRRSTWRKTTPSETGIPRAFVTTIRVRRNDE